MAAIPSSVWQRQTTRVALSFAAYLTLGPLLCHLLLSPLGFSPTDDGFTLAYSRRLLNLQIPHLDFISIRPVLSPLLHVPDLLFSKDYVFLISRGIVWFEVATATWLWSRATFRHIPSVGELERFFVTLLAFHCSLSVFVLTAWHTIDGLLFAAIGVYLLHALPQSRGWLAFVCFGLAILCKQSFVFAPFLIILILKEYRSWRNIVGVVSPVAAYALIIGSAGGFADLIIQISSHTDLSAVAIKPFLNREFGIGLALSAIVALASLVRCDNQESVVYSLRFFIFSVAPALAYLFCLATCTFLFEFSRFLFGIVCGSLILMSCFPGFRSSNLRVATGVASLFAWSSSLSLGSNWTVLASGSMIICLFAYGVDREPKEAVPDAGRFAVVKVIATAAVSLVALTCFISARQRVIYRDLPSSQLVASLDDILPGGRGIRTNQRTAMFLTELRDLSRVSRSLGRTYVVVPDCAGWWVASEQQNVLPIDWPQDRELSEDELAIRVIRVLDSLRESNDVLVQKIRGRSLVHAQAPIPEARLVSHVRRNYRKVHDGLYFEVYQ